MDEDEARSQLVTYARRLAYRGLVEGTEGNISTRLEVEGDKILIKPTAKEFGQILATDYVIIDLKGKKVAGEEEPSSEYLLHINTYKKRKDVNAIIHTHPNFTTALFSSLKQPIKFKEAAEMALSVSEVLYLPEEKPASPELASKCSDALTKSQAVILENHGIVAVGENVEEAFRLTIAIEKAAIAKFIETVSEIYLTQKKIYENLKKITSQLDRLQRQLGRLTK